MEIARRLGLNVNYIITRLQTKAIVRSVKTEYLKGVIILASDNEKLLSLLKKMDSDPTITCPRKVSEPCTGCEFNTNDDKCDTYARKAAYLVANGILCPPCKVGDTVYEVIAYKNKANGNRVDGHIRPCVVKSIHLSDAHSKKDEPYITLGAGGSYLHGAYIKRVPIDEFGKSIFPSEEQAEQKLKEMRCEHAE